MNIYAIKCDDGRIFITEQEKGYYSNSPLESLLFDGVEPEKSFCDRWFILKKEPKTIQRKVRQPDINHRYELIDTSMESDKIPIVLDRENVATYINYSWVWKTEFSHLQSLYELKSDLQPDKLEDVIFEFIVLMSVKDVPTPQKISYDVQRTHWRHEGLTQITNGNIINQLMDRLVFPKPILPQLPCRLSSDDTYKIVREYIKTNIDSKVAEITSDYDFCFTVKKKIPLSEPIKYQTDVNWSLFGRKRKPRMETRYRSERLVECFEMTTESKKYGNYTVIKGVEGANSDDLKEKLDAYLDGLIKFINEPIKDCPNCKGLGVIINPTHQEL